MRNFVLVSLTLSLILSTGVVQGVWNGRWSAEESLEKPVERLAQVPIRIGEWEGRDLELEANQGKRAGIAGFTLRNYRHAKTGEQLTFFLVCGIPGPISVHTPEVCYEGNGLTRVREVETKGVFQAATFREQNTMGIGHTRVYWAWTTNGEWKAPRYPRWTYARANVLHKLYVIRKTVRPDDTSDAVIQGFLDEVLPEVRKTQFEAQ